jgi:hypothetical protein
LGVAPFGFRITEKLLRPARFVAKDFEWGWLINPHLPKPEGTAPNCRVMVHILRTWGAAVLRPCMFVGDVTRGVRLFPAVVAAEGEFQAEAEG